MSIQAADLQTLLSEFAACSEALQSAIAGLSDSELDYSLTPQNWTIRQIVHHLADGDDLWKCFIKQAVGAPGTQFRLEWYWQIEQDEWVKHWAYARRAVEPATDLFSASRADICDLLSAVPDALERALVIQIPGQGEQQVTIQQVLEMQTHHVHGHIEEIQKIRALYRI